MNESLTRPAEKEMSQLADKVANLIALCDRLRLENTSLREQHGALIEERAILLEKNELARARVEAIIYRLKSLESAG